MFSILLLIIIYISFISLGLPDALLGSAWPSMYGLLNVPLHYAGIVSMIITGGSVLSCILSDKIIKRFGTGIVIFTSVFLTAASLAGISFSSSFILICLCAIPLGLGAGSIDTALNNYVALHYKARHMSWLHCFWGIGASAGPVIMAYYLSQDNSWNMGYRTISIIQFSLVFVLLIALPLWRRNKNTAILEKHSANQKKNLFSIPGVKEVLITFFCYCGIEMITGLWGASYLVTEKGIEPQIAAKWISLYYIGITAGRFISGFATMKFTNRQMIRLGQSIIGIGIIIIALPFGNDLLLPGLFLIGLGCAPVFPSLIHETPVSFGKENSQAIMGLQVGSAYIGTTVMPPAFGWLASFTGFGIFPVFIGIALIIKIFMSESLNRKVDRALLRKN